MKKAECTPEKWAAYREYQRDYYWKNHKKVLQLRRIESLTPEQLEQARRRRERYNARDDVKQKRAFIDAQPHVVERRRAYAESQAARIRAKERMRERFNADPELRSRFNNYGRFLRTGFTPELFLQLREAQGNRCAVCRSEFSEENRPHADHCHDRNEPRGLLCFQCNIIDGKLLKIGISPLEFGKLLQEYRLSPPAKSLISQATAASVFNS